MTTESIENSLRQRLEPRFVGLWQRCLLPGHTIDLEQAWLDLEHRYSETHRLYHSLRHLDYCLDEFDASKFLMHHNDTIEMAIWYHDIINSPEAKDNEYQSSVLFEGLAQDHLQPDFIQAVQDLILITTHRQTPLTHDQIYICDIDLSSMGDTWEKFVEDSKDLRAESEASREEYTIGKLRFFNALLERPRIFYSDYFYARYENQARHNIYRYISILNQRA